MLRLILLFGSTLLIGLTACSGGENNVERGNREGVLYVGNRTEPPSIDPHVLTDTYSANISSAVFETLVKRDPETLEVIPGAAATWTFSEDKTEITFRLQRRAKWSNGDPVTAEDFVWSWRRALSPELGMQQADLSLYQILNARALHTGLISDPTLLGVEALDEHTLHVRLEHPDAFALIKFSYIWSAPVHRKTVEAHGKATSRFSPWTRPGNFVGNGPFKLDEWKIQRHVSLERNEHYWDADAVDLERIVFRPIESVATEEKMFRSGQLHITDTVPMSKVTDYRQQPRSPLQEGPSTSTAFLFVNTKRPALRERQVRRALALAIDRDAIIRNILFETALASPTFVPITIPKYPHPDVLRFDPEESRALLAKAGYPDGRDFPNLTLSYGTSESTRTIAVALQQMWKDHLGIEVSIENQEWRVFLNDVQEGHYDLAALSWSGDVYPSVFLDIFVSDAVLNYSGFANESFDEIVSERAKTTASQQEVLRLHAEAERILLTEAPVIPLYSSKIRRLIQPGIRGVPINLTGGFNFKFVQLDPAAKAWQGRDGEP